MASLKHKIKINNSYESEPSSGSGSSLGEHPDYDHISYDDNFSLPYLLKPPSYDNEVTVTTSTIFTMASTKTMSMPTLTGLNSNNNMEKITQIDPLKTHQPPRDLMFGIPVNSSQESSFEGFTSSPFDKLQRLFYPNQQPIQNIQQPQQDLLQPEMPSRKPSPGKIVFNKFYDTIIEENSCNAVDMQMSKDNTSSFIRRSSTESHNSLNSDMNPSSELSFNGKIKSLTKSQDTNNIIEYSIETAQPQRLATLMETSMNTSVSLNTSQQFSESFILKKYSNEKSPDLFGDDDDEDDDDEDEQDENNDEDEDQPQQANLKTIHEHSTVLNESQSTHISCNLADNSFNCPTESSFANDDQTFDCSLTQGSGCFGVSGSSTDSYSLFKDNCRREREMLRRIRKCLAGVLPPPSVTIPQLDMVSAVLSRKDDIFNFFKDIKDETSAKNTASNARPPSLFRPTHTLEETQNMPWRDILSVRQHGLSFNLNKASENNEYLSLNVVERFIGAETSSSYQNSPSSAKKRNSRLKLLCQSPGNRLSHLAKRRAVFSSANLATQKTSTLVGPQILMDKKNVKNRRKATPKRMTPGSKKKNRKTPSSSARKRLFRNDIIKPGPSRETSKRALFQSPAKHVQQRVALPKPPAMKPELANRVEKSKRALLFTPEKQQQQKNEHKSASSYFAPSHSSQLDMLLLKRKRNHCDDNDEVDTAELTSQSSKLFKSDGSSTGLTPRALKIKSQSFCIGAGSSSKHKQLPCASNTGTGMSNMSLGSSNGSSSQLLLQRTSSVSSLLGSKLQRAYSDNTAPSNGLTENQKKKLLWAVSQALQERKITAKHESFKQYASILARVVRRIFQEFYQKGSTSNSETMLRLAKKYVYPVTAGSTADDIYLQAKSQIEDTKRPSTSRLSGYIGPEEYQQLKLQNHSQSMSQLSSQSLSHKGSMQNLFAANETSFDSFGLISQTSSGFCGSTNGMTMSQTSFLGQISQDIINGELSSQASNSRSASKPPIQLQNGLQNSSSKCNIACVVLRENVDCELRKSAQKNFTGKDQRNMSPYVGSGTGGSAVKAHTQLVTDSAKARRQISFDS